MPNFSPYEIYQYSDAMLKHQKNYSNTFERRCDIVINLLFAQNNYRQMNLQQHNTN